jgi:hypothetical protein
MWFNKVSPNVYIPSMGYLFNMFKLSVVHIKILRKKYGNGIYIVNSVMPGLLDPNML